jgi:hypothetical protein
MPKLELVSDKLEWGESLFRIQARLRVGYDSNA